MNTCREKWLFPLVHLTVLHCMSVVKPAAWLGGLSARTLFPQKCGRFSKQWLFSCQGPVSSCSLGWKLFLISLTMAGTVSVQHLSISAWSIMGWHQSLVMPQRSMGRSGPWAVSWAVTHLAAPV